MRRTFAPAHRDGDPRVAEVLRARRRQLGLTTEQAAKRAGCSVGMWSQLENAKRRPSIVMAEAIADALRLRGEARGLVLDAGLTGVGRDSPQSVPWRSAGVRHGESGRRERTLAV